MGLTKRKSLNEIWRDAIRNGFQISDTKQRMATLCRYGRSLSVYHTVYNVGPNAFFCVLLYKKTTQFACKATLQLLSVLRYHTRLGKDVSRMIAKLVWESRFDDTVYWIKDWSEFPFVTYF
jgi:hypothetical protein